MFYEAYRNKAEVYRQDYQQRAKWQIMAATDDEGICGPNIF